MDCQTLIYNLLREIESIEPSSSSSFIRRLWRSSYCNFNNNIKKKYKYFIDSDRMERILHYNENKVDNLVAYDAIFYNYTYTITLQQSYCRTNKQNLYQSKI